MAKKGSAQAFRFYDNRQKYLAFVNTCNEKSAVSRRAALELQQLRPRPPSLNLFDAGMGDGTVLSRILRYAHSLHPTVPVVAAPFGLADPLTVAEALPTLDAASVTTVGASGVTNESTAPNAVPAPFWAMAQK